MKKNMNLNEFSKKINLVLITYGFGRQTQFIVLSP